MDWGFECVDEGAEILADGGEICAARFRGVLREFNRPFGDAACSVTYPCKNLEGFFVR